MKPKQNRSNNNKSNNNKRHKQQLQQQQKKIVADEANSSRSDDVSVTRTADAMTSSVVVVENSSADDQPHSPAGDAGHVTDRCSDDVEVADILRSAAAVTRDDPGTGAEVTAGADPDVGHVTELIMAKTFTESTQPSREFVPIRRDTQDDDTDDVVDPLPAAEAAAGSLTVLVTASSAETASGRAMTSSRGRDGQQWAAGEQVRDLTSEMRRLQSLLDRMTSSSMTSSSAGAVDDSLSSEEEADWSQCSRVVYRYHLPHADAATGTSRRWIRRTGTPEEPINPQHQDRMVETRGERRDNDGERVRTGQNEPGPQQQDSDMYAQATAVLSDRLEQQYQSGEPEDLKIKRQERIVPDSETHLERDNQEVLKTGTAAANGKVGMGHESVVLPGHEERLGLQPEELSTQHHEDASIKADAGDDV